MNMIQDPAFQTALGYLVGPAAIGAAIAKIRSAVKSGKGEEVSSHIRQTMTGSPKG